MSLKELTLEKHKQAESTWFMKAVFKRELPKNLWLDWTYQKTVFYPVIEQQCLNLGLLEGIEGIQRSKNLELDLNELREQIPTHSLQIRESTASYVNYLKNLDSAVLAHLYTWHMGDMFGGQMIKKIVPGTHYSLEFENADILKSNLRSKLNDDLADEANTAFDFAIKMMEEYNYDLEQYFRFS
jgi:heme oxygenase